MSRQKPIALQKAIQLKLKSKQVGDLIKRAIKAADRRSDGKKWTQRLLVKEVLNTSEDILSRALLGKIHIDPLMIGEITAALNVGIEFRISGGYFAYGVHKNATAIIRAEEEITDAKKGVEKHTRGKKK